MGTRLIWLCIVACLRGGVWPGTEDSSAAGVITEVPGASGGGSEGEYLSGGFSSSTGASLEEDIEWTWRESTPARLEAWNPHLAEMLSPHPSATPSDSEDPGLIHWISSPFSYLGWGWLGSQWTSVRTIRARLAGIGIGLASECPESKRILGRSLSSRGWRSASGRPESKRILGRSLSSRGGGQTLRGEGDEDMIPLVASLLCWYIPAGGGPGCQSVEGTLASICFGVLVEYLLVAITASMMGLPINRGPVEDVPAACSLRTMISQGSEVASPRGGEKTADRREVGDVLAACSLSAMISQGSEVASPREGEKTAYRREDLVCGIGDILHEIDADQSGAISSNIHK